MGMNWRRTHKLPDRGTACRRYFFSQTFLTVLCIRLGLTFISLTFPVLLLRKIRSILLSPYHGGVSEENSNAWGNSRVAGSWSTGIKLLRQAHPLQNKIFEGLESVATGMATE